MTYKDNTPTYNSNRKVVNFGDYCVDREKEELKKVKRSIDPNKSDTQKFPRNSKYKFNNVTRKMDDLTPDLIDDELDNIESKLNESSIDYDFMDDITKLPAYNKLKEDFRKAISEFDDELNNDKRIEFDSGNTDHNTTYNAAIQEALNELM